MFRLRIKDLREAKGLSQSAFAKDFGVAQSTVGNWESGTREPNVDTIQKIADYFGVTVDYLLGRPSGHVQAFETENAPSPSSMATDQDIRRIARARKQMSPERQKAMMQVLEAAFTEYFSDDFEDPDTDE